MHRAFAIALLSLCSAALAASACSATYSSTGGIPDGALGGACFPNDTCDDGLACASQLCVAAPDAGDSDAGGESTDGRAPPEASTIDALEDDDASIQDAGPCGPLPAPLDPDCYDAGYHVCFSDTADGAACSSGTGPCNEQFQCNAASQCPLNQFCCLMGVGGFTGKDCPGSFEANGSNCQPPCNATSPPMCISDSDCPSGTSCAPATLTHDGVAYTVVGVCIK